MAPKKPIAGYVKLQIPAGAATPAPPVGPALGAKGVNIMQFCQAFNAATQDKGGTITPVVITVYEDKSFDFITKTPPAPVLIKEALGLSSGSAEPHLSKVGVLTKAQLRTIAETKLPDLNANDIEAAMKIIQGTARSMGVRVEGVRETGVYKAKKGRGVLIAAAPDPLEDEVLEEATALVEDVALEASETSEASDTSEASAEPAGEVAAEE